MAAPIESPTLLQLKKDLLSCFRECSDKGLLHAANWWDPEFLVFFPPYTPNAPCFRAIELANGIATVEQPVVPEIHRSSLFHAESIRYYMGKSLFDLREFRRAAHALSDCKCDEAFFLRCYSLFLVSGKSTDNALHYFHVPPSSRRERKQRKTNKWTSLVRTCGV